MKDYGKKCGKCNCHHDANHMLCPAKAEGGKQVKGFGKARKPKK